MYEAFEVLVQEMAALREEWSAYYAKDDDGNYCHAIHIGAREACEAAWAAKYPNKVYNAEKAQKLIPQELNAAVAPWSDKARAFFKDWFAREEELKTRMADAADSLEVPKAEDWLPWESRTGFDYHSQGFGANKYARNAVEPYADRARMAGIEVEIREQVHSKARGGPTCSGTIMQYTAWAKTTVLGREILRYKSGLSLREWVKSCWKRGVNPRVYHPFLDTGYEEAQGLDFFGGERKAS